MFAGAEDIFPAIVALIRAIFTAKGIDPKLREIIIRTAHLTNQAHLQALEKLIDGGVTHIFVQSPQQDQAKVITFYGEQVLPRL